jgi:hypothetical protein
MVVANNKSSTKKEYTSNAEDFEHHADAVV